MTSPNNIVDKNILNHQIRVFDDLQSRQLMSEVEHIEVCSHFGCSHHLTIEEQLYGNRCVDHQSIIKLTHVINYVI